MAAIASALVLNIGTLNPSLVESMIMAGTMANERKIPIVLDPVGAGATRLRTVSALRILDELDIALLKGNAGEIGVIAGTGGKVRGVDSAGISGDAVAVAEGLAEERGISVAISGATDIVTDGNRTLLVDNGHPMMGSISGTGCMSASVAGAFLAVSNTPVQAAAAAFAAFGIAGERAATGVRGPFSFKTALFDELALLDQETLARGAKIRKK
jgi:hydroxyethylthiazole kinase